MAQVYRKSALEKLSNPEQLENTLVVTSPMSWLAVIAVAVIIIATAIWAFAGTIPDTVSATGYVVRPSGANAVYSEENGKVISVMAYEDQEIQPGDVILTYQAGNREIKNLVSDHYGQVAKVCVKVGDSIGTGDEVVRVTPNIDGQCVVCYMPTGNGTDDAQKIEQYMTAGIYLSAVDSQIYGHMEGAVFNIDSSPATEEGKSYVLGKTLSKEYQGSYQAVTLYIRPDPDTESGFYWTNEKGKTLKVSNSSEVTVKFVVKEDRPIDKFSAWLSKKWGN